MRFVKRKESKSTLMHVAAEATTVNVVEEIKRRLRNWIELETPMLLDEFGEKLVETLTRPVWGRRPCNTVEVEWDVEPAVDERKRLNGEIEYFKEYHIDTIVCDGKKYELEAEYEYYYTPSGYILHSFKVKDVREAR
jgi:hypothetical protein